MSKLKFEYQMHDDGPKPCIADKDGNWVATVATAKQAKEIIRRFNAKEARKRS